MEEPAINKKGLTPVQYPSGGQFVVLLFIILFAGIFIEFIQTAGFVPGWLRVSGTVIICLLCVISIILLLIKPKGRQHQFITSTDAIAGNYRFTRTWSLVAGLFIGGFAVGSFANGYILAGILSFAILILDIIAAKAMSKGLRIDEAGNLYYQKMGDEMLLDFNYIQHVLFDHGSARESPRLIFKFRNDMNGSLPSKVKLNIGLLVSKSYGTPLAYTVLEVFIREKCEKAGLTIKTDSPGHSDWEAVRLS